MYICRMEIDELDIQMYAALRSVGSIFKECREKRGNDDETRAKELARRRAFSAALRLFANGIENPPDETTREPYPTKWMRNCFVEEGNEREDWMPLHFALTAEDVSISDIQYLLPKVGEAAYLDDVSPLSVAVAKKTPSQGVIKELIAFKPDAINRPDKDGAYALMYSAAWNDCELTLHSLYDASPDAMRAIDKFGFHAIHFACYVGCYDVCSYILQVYPQCVKIKTSSGVLPLCAAVVNSSSRSTEIVQLILDLYPEAVRVADDDGILPIHKASQFGTLDTVQLMYCAYKDGIMIPDGEGLLPMHYAGQRDKSREDNVEVLQFLLEKNEIGEVKNNSSGNGSDGGAQSFFQKVFNKSSSNNA